MYKPQSNLPTENPDLIAQEAKKEEDFSKSFESKEVISQDTMTTMTPREMEKSEEKSTFTLGYMNTKTSYGDEVEAQTYDSFYKTFDDYNDNKAFYEAWRDIESWGPTSASRSRHEDAIDNGLFTLDEKGNLVPGENYYFGAEDLFRQDALIGALLVRKNGIDEEKFNTEYAKITEARTKDIESKLNGKRDFGFFAGSLVGHLTEPETLIEVSTPARILGTTVAKGAAKAFATEFSVGLVAETLREQRIREHKARAGLEYGMWDSIQGILINAGAAGLIRGVGSAVYDTNTLRIINKGLDEKIAKGQAVPEDKEIFARWVRREQSKLTINSQKHIALLQKAQDDLDAGRPVDVAQHTDIDIETKIDEPTEEISIIKEVSEIPENIAAKQEHEQIVQEIDNIEPIKQNTDDIFEGMTTEKEANELFDEIAVDDAEFKAELEALRKEKRQLSERAQQIKQAKEPKIGGSEDEAKQEVKNLFAKNKSEEARLKSMSKEDIAELQRMEEEQLLNEANEAFGGPVITMSMMKDIDKANKIFAKGGDNLAAGLVAGIETDEEGNITFDPEKFIIGLGGYTVVKTALKNKAVQGKLKDYAEKAIDYVDMNPQVHKKRGFNAMVTGEVNPKIQKGLEKISGVEIVSSKLTDNKIVKIKPTAETFVGEITLLKNKEKAPNFGSRYGQDVEPTGYFAIQKESKHLDNNPNYETVKANIKNPLIVDVSDDLIQWKRDLSEQYNLKGKALSNKLIKIGYDSIITTDRDGDLGEIIILDTKQTLVSEKPKNKK